MGANIAFQHYKPTLFNLREGEEVSVVREREREEEAFFFTQSINLF
jgi:hypothetical protein